VHFIASDAHDNHYRCPRLSGARDAAAELIGEQAARALVIDHPRAVLNNGKILPAPARRYESKRRWLF
jgi:tyrosine-protein phosphatase YwqE